MKIVVTIKQVAVLDDEFELEEHGTGVDPDGVEHELNEWDAFSLEAALELKEASGDAEVIAVTVGENHGGDDVLLGALARGADRAVRVTAPTAAVADPLVAARVLAAVVGRESADLVLCGVQASDTVNGATGVALAEMLDVPSVAVIRRLELEPSGAQIVADRELEGGLVHRVRVALPALLTIQTGINEPRYATLRAIKQARDKRYDTYSLADLEIEARALEAGARARALRSPDRGRGAELLDGGPDAIAARIVAIIEERV
jgi:electron transfer flavoprotein beta subunit